MTVRTESPEWAQRLARCAGCADAFPTLCGPHREVLADAIVEAHRP